LTAETEIATWQIRRVDVRSTGACNKDESKQLKIKIGKRRNKILNSKKKKKKKFKKIPKKKKKNGSNNQQTS